MKSCHPQSLHTLHDIVEQYNLSPEQEASLRRRLSGRQVIVPEPNRTPYSWYRWADVVEALHMMERGLIPLGLDPEDDSLDAA